MQPSLIRSAMITCLLLLTLLLAPAQAELSPQQKLMSQRAAQLDAYRLLAERIMGFAIKGDSTVRDFVTENDQIATAFDTFLKGVRFSEPRYFDDGSCEIDAEVTIEQVITTLKKIQSEVYVGGKWKSEDFEAITKQTQRKVLAVTGSGAVRPNSVIPDPANEPIVRRPREMQLPDIFKRFPPNERLKAKRAAELDAYRLIHERIFGLAIRGETKVRDFVTESDKIQTAFEGQLKGVRTMSIRYAPDGVVEVEMQITIEQVVTTVKKVYDEVYQGGQWKKEYFDDISKRTERKVISVVGSGALDTRGAAGNGARPIEGGNDGVIIVD